MKNVSEVGFIAFSWRIHPFPTSTKPHAHQALPVFCPEVIRKPESTTGNTRGANLCLKLAHILPRPARDKAQQNPNRKRSPMELTFATDACPFAKSFFFSFQQAIVFIFLTFSRRTLRFSFIKLSEASVALIYSASIYNDVGILLDPSKYIETVQGKQWGGGFGEASPTSAPAHSIQFSPPRRTPQPYWILMLWCSQSISALQVPMLTLGIQPSVESSVETSSRHTLGTEAAIISGLCSETKCEHLPTPCLWEYDLRKTPVGECFPSWR